MAADGSDWSSSAPRFDVVLRGYDRRQVDEHLSRLNRVLARMRADLETARARSGPPMGPPTGRPRPSPRRRPDGESEDVVGTFTDRMRTILQAAEDEAAEIRARAQADARTTRSTAQDSARAQDAVRAELDDLVRQRDAVLADLTRVRGQLEALLSGPTGRFPMRGGPAAEPGTEQPLPGTSTAPPRGPDEPPRPAASVSGAALFGPADAPTATPAERTAFLPPPEPEPAERTALMPAPDPASGRATDAPPDATVKVPARPAPGEGPAPQDAPDDDRRPAPSPVSRSG